MYFFFLECYNNSKGVKTLRQEAALCRFMFQLRFWDYFKNPYLINLDLNFGYILNLYVSYDR